MADTENFKEQELFVNDQVIRGSGGLGRIMLGLIGGAILAGIVGTLVITGTAAALDIVGLLLAGGTLGAIAGWNPKSYVKIREHDENFNTPNHNIKSAKAYQLTPEESQNLQARLDSKEKLSHHPDTSRQDIHYR